MSPLFRPLALGIYALFLLVGVVCALVLPTLSLFLATEIQARPFLVGVPFAGVALMSIAYNHFLGEWSDRLNDRRPLIVFCCLVGLVVSLFLAYCRNYWLVASVVILFLSLALVSFSQLLAYSLDYAERSIPEERIPLFNAIVRAQIAVAWVAGPPLGFMLASYFSFKTMYVTAALMFLFIGLMIWFFLPSLRHQVHVYEGSEAAERLALTPSQKRALLYCVIGFSLMWGANNAYLISMPLHLKDGVLIGTEYVGWIMGTCAGLEIPFMLLAGYFAARINIMTLVRFAGISALLLYLGIYFADNLWQFFALQIFNAIFIGILAGLGVSVIQDLMPGRSGAASSLYTNTSHFGNLFSSLLVAVVADVYGYHQVFLVNLLIVVVAIFAFGRVQVKN